jgi:NAD(P)-dependent dehydrogenase (short-subunit alcohol dehydrogenase family)
MSDKGSVVVIGATAGIGLEIARSFADRGREVVISSRDADRAHEVAKEIGGRTSGVGLDLAEPEQIAERLAHLGPVHDLVLSAVERDYNTVRDYDVSRAKRLVTLKLVGYTEVVHALVSRMEPDSSIVLFGGLAKERPYVGSTTISTVNDAITGMVRTLALELAPIRVNALHPGVVGDHPEWSEKTEMRKRFIARTPLGRLVTIDEVVMATTFLLDHPSINAVNLYVDGGWMVT